eukprot:309548_1
MAEIVGKHDQTEGQTNPKHIALCNDNESNDEINTQKYRVTDLKTDVKWHIFIEEQLLETWINKIKPQHMFINTTSFLCYLNYITKIQLRLGYPKQYFDLEDEQFITAIIDYDFTNKHGNKVYGIVYKYKYAEKLDEKLDEKLKIKYYDHIPYKLETFLTKEEIYDEYSIDDLPKNSTKDEELKSKLLDNKNELLPSVKQALINIFYKFATKPDQTISVSNMSNYIKRCGHEVPFTHRVNVQDIFSKYETVPAPNSDECSLSLKGFLDFYRDACIERPLFVWDDLNIFCYDITGTENHDISDCTVLSEICHNIIHLLRQHNEPQEFKFMFGYFVKLYNFYQKWKGPIPIQTPNRKAFGTKIMILYHITNEECAETIFKDQTMKCGTKGMFGGGIYFAETPKDAHYKATHHGILITAQVFVGNEYIVSDYKAGQFTFEQLQGMGFDSIYAPCGSGSGSADRVVYNSDQVHIIKKTNSTGHTSKLNFQIHNECSCETELKETSTNTDVMNEDLARNIDLDIDDIYAYSDDEDVVDMPKCNDVARKNDSDSDIDDIYGYSDDEDIYGYSDDEDDVVAMPACSNLARKYDSDIDAIYGYSDNEGDIIDMNECKDDDSCATDDIDQWLLEFEYEQLLIETEQKIDILSTQINDLKSRRQEIKAFISNYHSTSKLTVESQHVNTDNTRPVSYLERMDEMNVFIKELRGSKVLEIGVNGEDTITNVKNKIQKICEYKIQFRLIFANEQLEDDKCVNDYNIQPGSTLY